MWFKQLSFYRTTPNDTSIDAGKWSEALSRRPFAPCGGLEWSSLGWIPPAPQAEETVYAKRGCLLVTLKREEKVLPGAVVRDFVEAKVAEIEDKELRKVGRKEKQQLKEQVTDDLLPRAFTKSGRTSAYLDNERGWLMVDTGTASRAEALISELRECVAGFPAKLPKTNLAPATAMTAWLADGTVGYGFELDSECELKAPGEEGAVVRVTRMDLTCDEVRQHIANGKQATRVGLVWNERIRFVLTETLQLKRLQFLDVLQEEASQAGDDAPALFEATFTLMSGELGDLLTDLIAALGGLQED
jgi:recombination associated protein RdgC